MNFKIIPMLGLKQDVMIDDLSLFKPVGENIALTHDVGGINLDYERKRNACTKALGYEVWDVSANAQATKCLGLFELRDGSNKDHIYFDNGKCFIYNSSRAPIIKEDVGSTTFANSDVDLYSMINFGGYMVFADRAEHTPYKWKNGDANLTKLILSGTEYKFRYLTEFQGRILGAYSDQTSGDLEIRWTDQLPAWASLSFPAANQMFKPQGVDPIVGIHKMGHNACLLYADESISRIDYYPDIYVPFSIVQVVAHQGCVNSHCVVDVEGDHYFFNKNYGFCKYSGGPNLTPISDDITVDVELMDPGYYNLIVGKFVPFTNEICWAVPLASTRTPSHLLFYNVKTNQWRKEEKASRYIDVWTTNLSMTWNDLINALGGTGAVWNDAGAATWGGYTQGLLATVFGNNNGRTYYNYGEDKAGAAWEAYRIEPALDFGDRTRKDRLLEIWFGSGETGSFNIDINWRGGDTAAEVENASWESLGSINLNNPNNPVLYVDKTERIHQIKWGTDLADEKFMVNEIQFNFIPQGKY